MLGEPATLPFADICIPSVFDDSLAPAGKHVMSMFTQWVPSGYADLRTPIRGLYQAGSATHGGGGVTGIPGRNVVGQILADRRAERWRRVLPRSRAERPGKAPVPTGTM